SKPFSITEVQRLLQHLRANLDRNGLGPEPVGLGEEFGRRELGMEGLFRIGALALQDLAPGAFVEAILDHVLSGLRSDAALLVLGDQSGQLTRTGRGRAELLGRLASLCGATPAEWAGESGMETPAATGPEPAITAVATLLPVAGNVMGLLCLGRDQEGGPFLPDEKELLRAYAQIVALGLQKIRLRDEPEADPGEVMSVFVAAPRALPAQTGVLQGRP